MTKEFEVLGAEPLLDLLVDQLPAYLFVKDEQFRIVAANRSFLSLYPEAARDSVIGTTTVEQYPEDQREKFFEQDRIAFEKGFTETTETFDFPDGNRRVLLTRKVAIQGADESRYIVGIATDVTDLHEAKTSAGELGQLIDASLNEIYAIDVETLRFVRVNRGAQCNLGFDAQELSLMRLDEIVADKSKAELEELLAPLVSGRMLQVVIEAQHRRRNGTTYDCEIHLQRGELGGREVLVAIALDTTELVARRDELARKNSELREFAHRTSHDFRAPAVSATALLEITQDLLESGDLPGAKDAITKALDALAQLDRFAEDVASLVRSDQEQLPVDFVDPQNLVDKAIAKLASFAEIEGVNVRSQHGCKGPLLTNMEQLARTVENLISNAIKYSDPEKPTQSVVVTTQQTLDGTFVLECRDNGLGVPERYRDQIFSMFQRFHPGVSFGSGLGLYAAKIGIERLGGSLEYEDLEDGSCFRINLPRDMLR